VQLHVRTSFAVVPFTQIDGCYIESLIRANLSAARVKLYDCNNDFNAGLLRRVYTHVKAYVTLPVCPISSGKIARKDIALSLPRFSKQIRLCDYGKRHVVNEEELSCEFNGEVEID